MYRLLFFICICLCFAYCNTNDEPATVSAIQPADKLMDSIAMQIGEARRLYDAGDTARSMVLLNGLLQKFPGQLDALNLQAEIAKAAGRQEEAIRILEKAYALQPRDKETVYNLAYEYADAKNEKALSITDTLLKYDKTANVARAWFIKGTYFENTGNNREALRYYDSTIIADINFLDAWLAKGQLFFRQKQYEHALKAFAQGQKISPATAEFYYWVGKTQEATGNTKDAKMNYENAYALDKTMKEAKAAADNIR